MQEILRCDLHDYIEIACMGNYLVRIRVKSGEVYEGVPKTTLIHDHREYLSLQLNTKTLQEIELITLKSMEVLTPKAKFTRVDF